MKSRTCMSAQQRAELWQRWKQGQSVADIAGALKRPVTTLQSAILKRGGVAPAARHRCARVLSLAEREEISRGLCAGVSMRQIARSLGRAASSVSREIARHGGVRRYRALRADGRAWDRARRPKACVLSTRPALRQAVAQKLQLQWSPQQISAWLEVGYASDDTMRVSHETIYRSLFIQARGVLKKELMAHLRRGHSLRRTPKARAQSGGQGQIIGAVSIRERPAQVEDRAVPGHWEGDLLCGGNRSQIATLVERHSRFVMLVKLPAKDTSTVVEALTKSMRKLPIQLKGSLTWDRGLELAKHASFTLATDMQVYFCDPRSPWQRGSNENTNGLLRQYFPKGVDVSGYSQAQLNQVALRLNQRPRQTLGFSTPADKLAEALR